MKRTSLQKNTNTDEQNTCEFPVCRTGRHSDKILFDEQYFNPIDNQTVKSFVWMKNLFLFTTLFLVVFYSCKPDDVIISSSKIVDNLDNYAISALAFDQSQTLWIACDTGLFKAINNGYELFDLGVSDPVTALAYENSANTMWVGTTAGLYQLKLGEADTTAIAISTDLVSNSSILSAYADENSTRWFGTEYGFTRSSGDTWQKDNFKQNATGAITSLPFHDFGINSIGIWDGDYFFATAGNKLWRTFEWKESVDAFTGATQWDSPYNGTAISDTMYVVFIDSQGVQWFGGKKGVQIHVGHDPKTNNYMFREELVNPNVRCIAEAPNGEIWCGTEDGISIYDGESWSALTTTFPNNFITSISFDGNKVWVGTKKGLFEIDF
ncbi:MAG: two-component regulator propeller domain-containing protein [Prolixibacteraceae bacterium]